METFEFLRKIIVSGNGGENGVYYQGGYSLSGKDKIEKPDWADYMDDYRDLTKKEMERFPHFTSGAFFTTIMAEGSKFIPYLLKKFINSGGKVVKRRIKDLNELSSEYDIVINCSGLGAKYLVPDAEMYPVRGQVIRIAAPSIKYFYHDDKFGGYILPNTEWVVVGGTNQPHDEDLTVSNQDRESILKNCSRLVPGIEKYQVLGEYVGQRPGRYSVRVEKEIRRINGKDFKIIHNYGHGGGGITLHWGCANEVTRLVGELVRPQLGAKL